MRIQLTPPSAMETQLVVKIVLPGRLARQIPGQRIQME